VHLPASTFTGGRISWAPATRMKMQLIAVRTPDEKGPHEMRSGLFGLAQ
jgi:hypothetical protein